MDGPTAISLVSIVVGGGVALAASVIAPIVAGKNQRRNDEAKFDKERKVRRGERTYHALYEATEALRAHQGAAIGMIGRLSPGASKAPAEDSTKFSAAALAAASHETKLRLLLDPESPVRTAYTDCVMAFNKLGATCIIQSGQAFTTDAGERASEHMGQGMFAYDKFIAAASEHLRGE